MMMEGKWLWNNVVHNTPCIFLHIRVAAGHLVILFQQWYYLNTCTCNINANFPARWCALKGVCSPERCWIHTSSGPDVRLLLDFFQPTVNLLASSGLQLKWNAHFFCSSASALVNLRSGTERAGFFHFTVMKRLEIQMTNTHSRGSHLKE